VILSALPRALRPLGALALALLLGAILIAAVQHDPAAPRAAYGALVRGAFGDTDAWAGTLARTTPLLLTGAAVAVALTAGLINIGAEGQMAVGGLAAVTVGFGLKDLPAPLLLPLALGVGALGGGLWAVGPALLRVRRGAHEVITAILLNYVAQNVTRYLVAGPLRDPTGQAPQTPEVGATLVRIAGTTPLHAGLPIAVGLVLLLAFAVRRSVAGYELRFVGAGSDAAQAAGIATDRVRVRAFVLSGALAGLAGAVTLLGAVPFRRFPADFYGVGYGFDGLAIALLAGAAAGRSAFLGVLPTALLFGALGAGAEAMAFETGTPKQLVQVIEAILIVAVAARFFPRKLRA
jgi:simple sugar transport system permease protein